MTSNTWDQSWISLFMPYFYYQDMTLFNWCLYRILVYQIISPVFTKGSQQIFVFTSCMQANIILWGLFGIFAKNSTALKGILRPPHRKETILVLSKPFESSARKHWYVLYSSSNSSTIVGLTLRGAHGETFLLYSQDEWPCKGKYSFGLFFFFVD